MRLLLSEEQRQALVSLAEVFRGSRCVLIGATALRFHVPSIRVTADVDLVVAIPEPNLSEALSKSGWTRDPKVEHRWHHAGGGTADVLSATEELLRAGKLEFENGGRSMSLVGFDLALRHTIKTTVPTTETEIEIALLPMLVVLKMVAWLDRPHERDRDLRDLARVLEEALPVDDPCRYDEQHAVWKSGLDHEDQSAFYVG